MVSLSRELSCPHDHCGSHLDENSHIFDEEMEQNNFAYAGKPGGRSTATWQHNRGQRKDLVDSFCLNK